MMAKFKLFLFLFTLALGLAGLSENAAKAGIVDLGNGFSFNDTDLVLTNSFTNKEWLSLTLTSNRSFIDIASNLATNGEFAGWNIATGADVNLLITLWTGQFFPFSERFFFNDELDSLIPYIGNTSMQSTSGGSPGIYASAPSSFNAAYGYTENFSSTIDIAAIVDIIEGPQSIDFTNILFDSQDIFYTKPLYGTFLFRDVSVVPLPPSAILFGTALLGLAGLRRRKRKT